MLKALHYLVVMLMSPAVVTGQVLMGIGNILVGLEGAFCVEVSFDGSDERYFPLTA